MGGALRVRGIHLREQRVRQAQLHAGDRRDHPGQRAADRVGVVADAAQGAPVRRRDGRVAGMRLHRAC